MSSDAAIQLERVGKFYRLRHNEARATTLGEAVSARIRHPFDRRSSTEQFWALRDISFEVPRGEIVGLVGKNGAGKSTLLKILSRITVPSEGSITMYGRVGSLLEVGTGFHPELTGRENIFLNGTILGMRHREVARRFDEILDFAGIEKFLDTPVKRYSSGMYVRLAFAVAAHLDTDILLVDEVLAVGDIAFQRKSLGKMSEVARDGRTVLVVSHNMGLISQLAHSCVLLDAGQVSAIGPTDAVVSSYTRANQAAADFSQATRPHYAESRGLEIKGGELISGDVLSTDENVAFALTVRAHRTCYEPRISYTVHRSGGEPVGSAFSEVLAPIAAGEEVRLTFSCPDVRLTPGGYTFAVAVGETNEFGTLTAEDWVIDVLAFQVAPGKGVDGELEEWHYPWGPLRWNPPKLLSPDAAQECTGGLSR